jgi:hypothetical protein
MRTICVAHLVRAANGIQPLHRFLESYSRNPGGIEHDLLLIFKGFRKKELPAQYRQLLGAYPHETLFVEDRGYDVLPYFVAADTYNHPFFCFLNSFSLILDEHWLRKMYTHVTEDGVGIVGATGSCESMYTDLLAAWEDVKRTPIYRRMLTSFTIPMRIRKLRAAFYPFPNYHVRTNAFMIPAELMRRITHGALTAKIDAWQFESGKAGLTQQILKMNLKVMVVGRDGRAYEKEDWFKSRTFRQGVQSNLLVADNQTNAYLNGNVEEKRRLSRMTWGDKTDFVTETENRS